MIFQQMKASLPNFQVMPLLAAMAVLSAAASAQQQKDDESTPPQPPQTPQAAQSAAALSAGKGQPVPRTPLVPRAPARAEWTVRLTPADQGKAGEAEQRGAPAEAARALAAMRTMQSLHVSKDEQMQTYRLRSRWSDGGTEEEWIVMGKHVAERPGGRGLYIVGAEATTAQDLQRSDFPELDWLEMSLYRGLKPYQGKKVFVFSVPFDQKRMSRNDAQLFMLAKQKDPTLTPSKFFKPKSKEAFIYLDSATQLPVYYNDGSIIREYSFTEPSESRLRPSEAVIAFLRARSEALRVRLATPPGP